MFCRTFLHSMPHAECVGRSCVTASRSSFANGQRLVHPFPTAFCAVGDVSVAGTLRIRTAPSVLPLMPACRIYARHVGRRGFHHGMSRLSVPCCCRAHIRCSIGFLLHTESESAGKVITVCLSYTLVIVATALHACMRVLSIVKLRCTVNRQPTSTLLSSSGSF